MDAGAVTGDEVFQGAIPTPAAKPALEELWARARFKPNDQQCDAITYVGGPLYLTAGPGSGKTRVLLWRTVNLILYRDVRPDQIFLSTFTEKAARQLQEGLRALLSYYTALTGKYFDLSSMYIGTLHSLCQRLIVDRRFSPGGFRPRPPLLMDELKQYLYFYRAWKGMLEATGWGSATTEINRYFDPNGYASKSRHRAVTSCIALFNRFSEECFDPAVIRRKTKDPTLKELIELYSQYCTTLAESNPRLTDYSLLQQEALKTLQEFRKSGGNSDRMFRHVIIDEYQDTNTIQEKLVFELSSDHKNICVVGDDDQALYRFRGATVENFVDFPERLAAALSVTPKKIPLVKNYRSRKKIVDFYGNFITHGYVDWRKKGKAGGHYRVIKKLTAHREDDGISVVASDPQQPDAVCSEIAGLVKEILDSGKVQDPNQVAFLFPSLKSKQVERMMAALDSKGLKVYAPRARTFLDVDECVDMLGLFMHTFGKPERQNFGGQDYANFYDWVDVAFSRAKRLIAADANLRNFVVARCDEVKQAVKDYEALLAFAEKQGWGLNDPYRPESMKQPLRGVRGIAPKTERALASRYVERMIRRRAEGGRPVTLKFLITRATSLDWNILDLFYRFCGFEHFRGMFDAAEGANGARDEGPVCNLSLLSNYLSRFLDEYSSSVLSAQFLAEDRFQQTFFSSYLFALYRRGESEYEDAEDPFPRGRIPFLTIHQAKGLEFPVVVLGNPRKKDNEPQFVERVVRPFLAREGEPLDRIAQFDVMRMFYVALSRAKNLLVLAHYRGQGQQTNEPFASMLDGQFKRIRDLNVGSLPVAEEAADELPKTYSYTGDYLLYKWCPRQYMSFRKYGFAPSRSQTMFFGSLVHQTIDDLHHYLLNLGETNGRTTK